MPIHYTAIIDKNADIDPEAIVGPYVIVDGRVRVGPRTRVFPHAYLTGWTEIGADCQIHPGAVVGHLPQDVAYRGAETYCRIGDGTILREGTSVHRGTDPQSGTVIGSGCYLMATTHVAHNCTIEDDVKIANGTMLGGHVRIGEGAFIGGGVAVHQFVRIGALAMIAGMARVIMDVPPFFLTDDQGKCAGTNHVGMRRAEFSAEECEDVKRAYQILYRSGATFRQAVERLDAELSTQAARRVLDFCRAPSRRGITGGVRRKRAAESEDRTDL